MREIQYLRPTSFRDNYTSRERITCTRCFISTACLPNTFHHRCSLRIIRRYEYFEPCKRVIKNRARARASCRPHPNCLLRSGFFSSFFQRLPSTPFRSGSGYASREVPACFTGKRRVSKKKPRALYAADSISVPLCSPTPLFRRPELSYRENATLAQDRTSPGSGSHGPREWNVFRCAPAVAFVENHGRQYRWDILLGHRTPGPFPFHNRLLFSTTHNLFTNQSYLISLNCARNRMRLKSHYFSYNSIPLLRESLFCKLFSFGYSIPDVILLLNFCSSPVIPLNFILNAVVHV